MFSKYLNSKHDICKELVDRLSKRFAYVSLLGKQITGDDKLSNNSSVIIFKAMQIRAFAIPSVRRKARENRNKFPCHVFRLFSCSAENK